MKSRETTAGGATALGLTGLLRELQGSDLPGGFNRITALNDAYHRHANPNSMHTRGLAGDVTLRDPRYSAQAAEAIRERLRSAGLDPSSYKVLDEYRNPSGHATGGHLHVQFNNEEAAERYRALTEAAQGKQQADVGDGIKQVHPWQKIKTPEQWEERREIERERRRGLQLSRASQGAIRSAVGQGGQVSVDGAVHINVQTTDPKPRVTSGAKGSLFREVRQSRGRQMAPAGDD